MKFFLTKKKHIIINLLCLIIIIAIIGISLIPALNKPLGKILPPFASVHNRDIKLTLRKTYLECRHVEIVQKKFDAMAALKDYIRSNGLTPGKNVPNNSTLVYTTAVQGLCKTCGVHRFLGIRGEQVVVIYGIPAKPGPVQENTGIDIRKLPVSEISDLKTGILLKDNKEKLQLIEGLKSLVNN